MRFAEGTASGTGTIDAVTSDYAIIWVWTDEGQGRRMFLQGYGSTVALADGDGDAYDGGT